MPFWNNDDDVRADAPGFGPTPAPEPAGEPAGGPDPAPMPVAEPAPAAPSDPEPPATEPEPEAEAERPAARVKAKAPRMNERIADAILSTRALLDDPTVRAAMTGLTGRESDEELTALMLRIRHGMNGRPPERRRLRDVLVRAYGHDSDARLALTLLDGHVDGARLLVDAHDEPDPVNRVTMLLSAGMRDAQRLRAAARLLVALDPSLSERVRPQAGSQMDLAGAVAQTVAGVDVEPVRGLA